MTSHLLSFGVLVVMLVMGAAADALAQEKQRWVDLQVDCVLATDTNEGVDVRLAPPMGPRLRSLFSYTTFRLVSHQNGLTEFGRMVAFTLPGGRILNVQPRGVDDDMIAMELVMFQGAVPMMTTEFRLKNRGVLMIGGPRYEKGMLIISIAANTTDSRPKGKSTTAAAAARAVPTEKSANAPAARD